MPNPPLRTARLVVVVGYVLLAIATGLTEIGSRHNVPEPGAITVVRIATLGSFVVIGWAWWLQMDSPQENPNVNNRRRLSFVLFALAALILAIGQVSITWYYAFAQLGPFRWASRLGVITVAAGLTAIGYLVVTAGFWLATRVVSASTGAASSGGLSPSGGA